ncbi:hypothetical protein BH11MYX3_BH11MYX3_33090 [soil metagenome]
MNRLVMLLALASGCGGASYQQVQLVNKTPRPISEVYIFPTGSANHGASRGTLAPDASLAVKVKSGNVDVLAISAKVRVNDTETETRTATQTLELKKPVSLVFHDSTQTLPGLDQPGTIGVVFQVAPEPEGPAPAP